MQGKKCRKEEKGIMNSKTNIMKSVFISILFFIVFCGTSLGQETPLTPELVIKGGYFNHDINDVFPEKIEGVVNYTISKDDISKSIATFAFINKFECMERDGRFVFHCRISVGTDMLSTPIGKFARSKSDVSFVVVIDISNNSYKYKISNMQTERRSEKVNSDDVNLATKEDLERLKDAGFDVGTFTLLGIELPTKGDLTSVYRKRVAGLIAERNGYVNLCIQNGKTVNGLKSKWVEKINEMDERIASEIQHYEDEYNAILEFIKIMNTKINEN